LAKPRLIAVDAAESRKPEYQLIKAEITVGSEPGNGLVLTHSSVSRRHAVIRRRGKRFEVSDLDSSNGTFVNEHRIYAPTLIDDRAQVRFGGVRLVFLDPRARARSTSRRTTGLRTRARRVLEAALILFLIGFGTTEYLLNGDFINQLVRRWATSSAAISTAQPVSPRTGDAASRDSVNARSRQQTPSKVVSPPPIEVSSETPPREPAVVAGPPWLTRVNYYRQLAKLPAVGENDALSDGDRKHARYIVENYASVLKVGASLGSAMHTEDSEKPWYTPEGFAAAQNSDLYEGCNPFDVPSAIDGWMEGPFHRISVLDPNLTSVGFGEYENGGCWTMGLDLHLGPESKAFGQPIEFPPPDSTLSLQFVNDEWPDPLAACPGYSPPAGLPITLELGPLVDTKLGVHSLLRGTEPVEHCAIDASNYSNADGFGEKAGRNILKGSGVVMMIPRQPLTPGQTYSVSIVAQGATYNWSFKVAAKADSSQGRIEKILNSEINRGDAAHIRLHEGSFQRGNSVFDGNFIEAKIVSNVAFGDLEGDGRDEAVAVLGTSGGGSGYFPELHVFSEGEPPDGKFVDTAYISLGDRVVVQSMRIESREIVVNLTVHGPTDAVCCPTLKTVQRYKFDGEQLRQTGGIADYPEGGTAASR